MFLIFIISLSALFYFICLELDRPAPPGDPLSGECPDCSTKVVSGWLVCPQCRRVLRETCYGCGKVHDNWVKYCPWCRRSNNTASI